MASVLDLVKHYQHTIEKYPTDEHKVLKCIDKLFNLAVTVQHLQDTGVGRTVNALRKEPGDVGQAARSLVYKWKLMVAAEESDQETDKQNNDTTTHNGHGTGKDSYDNAQSRNKTDRYERSNSASKSKDHREINENYSGSKRKYHSSEDEEPNTKQSKHSSSSEDDYKRKSHGRVKSPETDSDSNDDSDSSQSDESDSEMSDSSQEEVKVKQEIKKEHHSSHKSSSSKHSSHNEHADHKSSSSKRPQEPEKHSRHHSSQSKERHSSEKSSSKEKSHSSDKHKSLKEKEASLEKKHKTDHKSDAEKNHKESKSSARHSSLDKHNSLEKQGSSDNQSSSDKHNSSDKHSSLEKHRSSSSHKSDSGSDKNITSSDKHSKSDKHRTSSHSHAPEKEKHKSSSEKEISKHKVKESTSNRSSSKERHSSSSKEKSKDRNSSSKEKLSSHSSEKKKHSSSNDNKSSSSSSKAHSEKSDEKSSDKKSKHRSSSSSHKSSKSSSTKNEEVPKKKVQIQISEDSDDGIDCGSGASFAEALGMVSPAKPKKKSLKDPTSPNNDFSPAAMLAPTAKLAPLPSLEISALPEISPNYKPRPPPRPLPHFNDEDAMSAVISSKNQRTKVYSGNKVIGGKIPSLYEMCVTVLQEHIDALEYTGGVPYEILKPVVDRATPQQLFILEHYNPYLMEDTDHLWQKFCQKNFRNKQRQEMEAWREMYTRCQEEQEIRLKSLTANIKIAQEAKKAPIKQTKMAYVDSVAKPPRNIAKKQAQHGTARMATGSPAARVASLAAQPNVLRGGAGARALGPLPSSTSASLKPKKAPLMAKALQIMRGRKR